MSTLEALHRCINAMPALPTEDSFQSLRTALSELDSDSDVKSNERTDTLPNLRKWLESNGAFLSPLINLARIDKVQGNGVVAIGEIPVSEILVEIPLSLMITSASSPVTSLLASDVLIKKLPNVNLALALLYESITPSSFYSPYIASLPTKFSIPISWSVQDIFRLKGTSLYHETMKFTTTLARFYTYIHHQICENERWSCYFPLEKFTWSRYLWALCTVMTRQNKVESTMALIPGYDMFNNDTSLPSPSFTSITPTTTTTYDPATQTCTLLSHKPFQTSDQVTMIYGARSNKDLLFYSGFVGPTVNECDVVTVCLNLGADDPLREWKLKVAFEVNLKPHPDFYTFHVPSNQNPIPIPPTTLKFLRLFLVKSVPESHAPNISIVLSLPGIDVSSELDRAVVAWVLTRCKLMVMKKRNEIGERPEVSALRAIEWVVFEQIQMWCQKTLSLE